MYAIYITLVIVVTLLEHESLKAVMDARVGNTRDLRGGSLFFLIGLIAVTVVG